MESMFIVLVALIAAVRAVSPSLADALEVVVKQLKELAMEAKDDADTYRRMYFELADRNDDDRDRLAAKLAETEMELNKWRSNANKINDFYTSREPLWSVSLPLTYLNTHKIQCIKLLREVYPISLRDAKEKVEYKIETGDQLFTELLTSAQLLTLEKAINWGTNPIPRSFFMVSMEDQPRKEVAYQ